MPRIRIDFRWGVLLVLAASGAAAPGAYGLAEAGRLERVSYRVFAPDWTWQQRDINVLVVLENGGRDDANVDLSLVFPKGKESHFDHKGAREASVTVRAGGAARYAFTNITARDGVPRQIYDFALVLAEDGKAARVAYPVRTIRGAVVSPGQWALYLPAGLALVWSAVFALVLPHFAAPGAWRRPGDAMPVPADLEPWIHQGVQ